MKHLFFILLVITILSSCKTNKDDKNNFQIDVSIQDIPNGRKAILKKQVNRKIVNLDTAIVKDGKFSFKGNIKEPLIFGIFIDSIKKGGLFPFTGIGDHITIEAYKDSLVKSKISGSKLHDELTRLRKKRDELSNKTKKFLPEFQKANRAKPKDTATINSINKKVKAIRDEMVLNDWNYVKSHPKSYVTPLVFNGLMTNPKFKDSVKIVFDSFDDKIKKSDLAKPIKNYFDFIDKQKKAKTKKPTVKTTTKK